MEKIVGDLIDIMKALVAAHKARGEALDKSVTDRLERAERELYEARKEAHEREAASAAADAVQGRFDLGGETAKAGGTDEGFKKLADALTADDED
jgi:hypothetical protein